MRKYFNTKDKNSYHEADKTSKAGRHPLRFDFMKCGPYDYMGMLCDNLEVTVGSPWLPHTPNPHFISILINDNICMNNV